MLFPFYASITNTFLACHLDSGTKSRKSYHWQHEISSSSLFLPPAPRVGYIHTNSSAIHKIDFVGQLMAWPNFEREVITTFSLPSTNWNNDTLDVRVVGFGSQTSISEEQMVLGDEIGLQGRLGERLGRPVTSSLQAQQHRRRMGDFKASRPAAAGYRRIPDMVLFDGVPEIKVVGGAKAPWPDEHINMLSEGVDDFEAGQEGPLRRRLGQVARYMRELNVKHGFLSTYEETIFLRKVDVRGVWTLQYSTVIAYDDPLTSQTEGTTTQQGLYHVALLGQADSVFTRRGGTRSPLRNHRWTISRE
ncbi:phosphoglycerate mutase family protein [Penicillium digitatum]|uniref:Phosphoglycerate mutase family protein n=1 Tax=Penicillium digitatum TaxID=36651 RepID=A0A7T7BHH5_PENDI|nr:phosphoglycerate mutase family protein [Penicillium digitatum]